MYRAVDNENNEQKTESKTDEKIIQSIEKIIKTVEKNINVHEEEYNKKEIILSKPIQESNLTSIYSV